MSAFIYIALWTVTAIFLAHAVVFNLTTAWTYKNIELIWRGVHDPEAKALLAHREANPPWFKRYSDWLNERLDRIKNGGAS